MSDLGLLPASLRTSDMRYEFAAVQILLEQVELNAFAVGSVLRGGSRVRGGGESENGALNKRKLPPDFLAKESAAWRGNSSAGDVN